MRVTIDLPQDHQKVGLGAILSLLDMIYDLIRNNNFEDKPQSWELTYDENEKGTSAKHIEPYFPKSSTKPNLRVVH